MSDEKKGKYFVVENLFEDGISIPHPDYRLQGKRDLALGSYEAQVVSYEEWKDSPLLEEKQEQERVKVYFSDERPAPLPTLPPEAPNKRHQKRIIWTIAFGEGNVEVELGSGHAIEEGISEMLINLVPDETTTYEGPGKRRVLTSAYLKDEHYETLYWAKWLLENFPRAKHKKRIKLIEKRMKEIEAMP